MDKCWFVLRQTHYPAPRYAHPSMAFGDAEGPLRLGHLIPSPKELDQVINSGDVTPFPPDMPIWATEAVNLRFSNSTEKGFEPSAKAGAPVVAASSLTISAEAGAVFKQTMGNTWAIDRLDTQIVQLNLSYLERCRSSREVAAWVEKKSVLGTWKAYMVTGLMIARGAKNENTDETYKRVGGSGHVPSVPQAAFKVEYLDKNKVETATQHITDFIWAIRISEVSRSLFRSGLSLKTVTKGAVFSKGSDEVNIKAILAEEGFDGKDIEVVEVLKGSERQFFISLDGC